MAASDSTFPAQIPLGAAPDPQKVAELLGETLAEEQASEAQISGHPTSEATSFATIDQLSPAGPPTQVAAPPDENLVSSDFPTADVVPEVTPAPPGSTDQGFPMTAGAPPSITFALQNVQPPSNLYVTPNDAIEVSIYNSFAGVEVDLNARFLGTDGLIHQIPFQFFPTSNRAKNSSTFGLAEGFLLDLIVTTPNAGVKRGQCFVVVQLNIGLGAPDSSVQTLCQDYIASGHAVQWPGGQIRQSVEGPGWVHSGIIAGPGSGLEQSVTVPTGARWSFKSILMTLTTDATVANRTVRVVLDDGVNRFYELGALNTQAGSLTGVNYNVAPGLTLQADSVAEQTIPLPVQVLLMAGFRLRTLTVNFKAGDSYGNAPFGVEEWIEP